MPIERLLFTLKKLKPHESRMIQEIIYSLAVAAGIINHMLFYDRLITFYTCFMCAFKILTFTVFIAHPVNCLIVNRFQSKLHLPRGIYGIIFLHYSRNPLPRLMRNKRQHNRDEEKTQRLIHFKKSVLSFTA